MLIRWLPVGLSSILLAGCIQLRDKPAPFASVPALTEGGADAHTKHELLERCGQSAAAGHVRERRGIIRGLAFYYGQHRDALRRHCSAFADEKQQRIWRKIHAHPSSGSDSQAFLLSCLDAAKLAVHKSYDANHFEGHRRICSEMAQALPS